MSVDAFVSHIASSSPAFRCYSCGDKTEQLKFTAQLVNALGPPATSAELEQLHNWLGIHASEFVDLYSRHNGFALYRDTVGDAEGIGFYPVEEWKDQTEGMISQFEAMGFGPDEQPEGVNNSLAFAEIPHSGNYFTVKVSGPEAGKVFYADHDDFSDEPFATSLINLLNRITNDPPQFLYDVGCYTRYSDGRTSKQWIPKEYLSI